MAAVALKANKTYFTLSVILVLRLFVNGPVKYNCSAATRAVQLALIIIRLFVNCHIIEYVFWVVFVYNFVINNYM